MAYQLLKNRGALNEAEIEPQAALSAPVVAFSSGIIASSPLTADVPAHILELIPESVARENLVVPQEFDGERLTVAAVNPQDIALADKLRFILAKDIRLIPAPREWIVQVIHRLYGRPATSSVDSMLHEFTDTAIDFDEHEAYQTRAAPRSLASRAANFRSGLRESAAPVSPRPALLKDPRYLGRDPTLALGRGTMFFYVVEEGQRVLMRRPNGTMEVLVGPKRVWHGHNVFHPMQHFVAHPDQFLIVRYRDGRQEHLVGPADIWFDPRIHLAITHEDALQISAKEAVVVYTKAAESGEVTRRIVYGPTLFVPQPGEWLHTFSWHASKGGSQGAVKVANALVFQKLWLMPDQMYHDVREVRTADDAVLTIRLMIFFELIDVERMLDSSHDPIGDFVNAATSDVVGFTGQHDFESFKHNTTKLNDLDTYRQLTGRAAQCGYRMNKVVFRGYDSAAALQQMHDQAIQARTRLQLERATEQQAQDLENYKLESQLARASKRRVEQLAEVAHDLGLAHQREEAEIRRREAREQSLREIRRLEQEGRLQMARQQDARQREHLTALRELGVDLTKYLTQARADQVIEVRSKAGHHVHLQPNAKADPQVKET